MIAGTIKQIAVELLFRGLISGLVANSADPVAECDRMENEFRSSAGLLRIGDGDDHAEHMRALIVARVDENFDAIRTRALRDIEIEAARSGNRN